MIIGGFQKLTLLDYPDRTAALIFLRGCNFRCPYCHNAALIPKNGEHIAEEEVFAYLERRRGLLDGVCVSGGEPLLSEDCPALMERLKRLGFSVKLDTNGSCPERLREVVEAGLADYVAMDFKHTPERYAAAAGIPAPPTDKILASAEYLKTAQTEAEFRTTVCLPMHEPDDLKTIGRLLRGPRTLYLQAYQENPFSVGSGLRTPASEQMRLFAEAAGEYVNTEIR